MKLLIRNRADYVYEERVSFSPHIFRLFPKTDAYTRVDSCSFETNANAIVRHRRDLFDNPITHCFYPEHGDTLHCDVSLVVEVKERNPFDFLLENRATKLPFDYSAREAYLLAPYLDAEKVTLPFWKFPSGNAPTVDTLIDLNTAIFESLEYERREEGAARSPEETLAVGSAACRDFGVLLAAATRQIGLASRLASGFLCEFEEEEKDRKAEGALHAWTEVFLPGAGWLGMDPTNGTLCTHHHITAAVGLTPDDIAPVLGSYFGDRRVPSRMDAKLEMTPCEQ
jgi:transglutaminase-like putative cysteine protease